jgi:GTP cyclohydrolase I
MSSKVEIVQFTSDDMPDIASHEHQHPQGTLDWVGMSQIHQPVLVREGGDVQKVNARVQVYVDLANSQAKGIHMSRLYLLLDRHASEVPLTAENLVGLLEALLDSHTELSTRAFLSFEFDYFLRRRALKSNNSGWNSYPVKVRAALIDGELHLELGAEVLYASTCPCSTALAWQLVQQQFDRDFAGRDTIDAEEVSRWIASERGVVAAPHSQRSVAKVLTRLNNDVSDLPLTHLIDLLEGALQTPVQTAVKREDEQEFARRNGQNLMFCEDAARRIKNALNEDENIDDFWGRVDHMESLHPHDAVSVFTKGVKGGYLPIP